MPAGFGINPAEVDPGDLVYYNNDFNGGSASTVYPLAWVVRRASAAEITLLAPVYFPDGAEDAMFWVYPVSPLTAPLAFGSAIGPPIAVSQLMGLVKAYADQEAVASWLPPVTALP